ncbi:MAG TPA: TonB-dependent receptor [Azospirillaceae bacterium]|nr:TonB-dependent receptor [Azospirillaceae bacterium]
MSGKWWGITAASALALCGSVAAAQEASPDDLALEEIVVTARKMKEGLQDVPVAVTAITDAALRGTAYAGLSEIERMTPGLFFKAPDGARSQPFIRGIGSRQFDAGSEASVGVFIDGIYMARFQAQSTKLLDVERIEVLKGPQGALYGRNTIGGAISVVTKRPSATPEGTVEVGWGRFDDVRLATTVSGPVVDDTLLFRVSASHNRDNGFMKLTRLGGRGGNGDDSVSARGKLLWLAGDALEAELSLDYLDRNAQGRVEHLSNAGGRRSGPYLANTAVTTAALTDPTFYERDLLASRANFVGFQDQEAFGATLRVDYQAPVGTLTSLTGVRESSYVDDSDFDASEFEVVGSPKDEDATQFSEELRLSSRDGGPLTFGGRVNWLLGLYYFEEDVERSDFLVYGRDNIAVQIPSFGGRPHKDDLGFSLDTQSYAAFGQVEFSLTEQLRLTGGLRYTKDEKEGLFRVVSEIPGGFVPASYTKLVPAEFDSVDPSLSLRYSFTEDTMAYVSYTNGFKSGAFQFTALVPSRADLVAKPESVDSYELGMKTEFLDKRVRLNGALFYQDYRNLQVPRILDLDGIPVVLLSNADKSRIKGLELELTAVPAQGLQVGLGYAYLDAQFKRFFVDPARTIDFSGFDLPRSPRHSVNAMAQYSMPVALGELSFRTGYRWIDDHYFEPDNNDPGTKEEAYGLLDASVTLDAERWYATLWGQNLTDERYRVTVTSQTSGATAFALKEQPGRPRTYGVTLGYRF